MMQQDFSMLSLDQKPSYSQLGNKNTWNNFESCNLYKNFNVTYLYYPYLSYFHYSINQSAEGVLFTILVN